MMAISIAVLPLIAVPLAMLPEPLSILVRALAQFLSIYLVLLLIRVLLGWFPNVNWSNPVFSTLSQVTDPYLNLFRSIIPPLGGMDFSPILAFLLLQFAAGFFNQIA